MSSIRIATRNSPLALWQANYVKDQLHLSHSELEVEIVGMTTKGDQLLDRSLSTAGGKGLFLKELEVSLLNNETDIAVHSMKDVPVTLPTGLEIAVLCERADPHDAFVSNKYQNLYALPAGSRVGTSSLRRVSQLKAAFPNIEFVDLRGNVNTRLAKLDADDYDAIILAAAGLARLGFEDRIRQIIKPELCLPAVGQGIIGIECRSDDVGVKKLLEPLHNRESELCLAAERTMNAHLEGGCHVPVAGYAELVKGKIHLRGLVGKLDGSKLLSADQRSDGISIESAQDLGTKIAESLLAQGAKKILHSINREPPKLPKVGKPVVLLTRQKSFLGNTAKVLERLDYQPIHLPTIRIEPRSNSESAALFESLDDYTDILFVSRNAVEVGMSMITERGAFPAKARALTVGAETAKQLYGYGIDAMFPETGSGIKALLDVSQLADLSGRNILVLRGKIGLDWPSLEMRQRGAEVNEAIMYDQLVPSSGEARLESILNMHRDLEGVFAHSVQGVVNLIQLAGEKADRLLNATLVAGSVRISDMAKELGWAGEIRVAQSPSNKHMMISFSRKYQPRERP